MRKLKYAAPSLCCPTISYTTIQHSGVVHNSLFVSFGRKIYTYFNISLLGNSIRLFLYFITWMLICFNLWQLQHHFYLIKHIHTYIIGYIYFVIIVSYRSSLLSVDDYWLMLTRSLFVTKLMIWNVISSSVVSSKPYIR